MGDLDEPRLVTETGQEARVALAVEPAIRDLGYRLVRIKLSAMNGATLQIMAERPDGSMSVEDCEEVSRTISPILDVEEPVKNAYHLEISSPGIDRPLVRLSDFSAWAGHTARIETRSLFKGRKRFKGVIGQAGANGVVLNEPAAEGAAGTDCLIPLNEIGSAKLMLDDTLIREALKRDKTQRQEEKAARKQRRPETK